MLHSIVEIMTPFLLAGLGGLFTERAGVLNIALEGLMLIGAFSAAAVAGTSGNLLLGTVAAVGISATAAYLYATAALHLKANIFIAALAVNLLAIGGTQIAAHLLFGTKGVIEFAGFPSLPSISIPLLSSIPVFKDFFTDHSPFVYIAFLLVPISAWLLNATPFGMYVKAAGLNSTALFTRGVAEQKIKVLAITISGITCGLAGASLSFNLGAYVPNITSGRGWIALVAIFLGYKRPYGVFLVALLFAAAELAAQNAQGIAGAPASLLLAFPFFITFIGMIIFSALHALFLRLQEKNRY
ncbi:MAG: ABC transporter permease [Spirochaetaceae bacterium]|nr:ABC transporter permease [Spirochaetaceae bacterium]MCF7948339.1 ABC transporter permease [Spirochaetia bacterium]MCF7952350.1 ABC transporter permease [Spirochaetaceae bacterium]